MQLTTKLGLTQIVRRHSGRQCFEIDDLTNFFSALTVGNFEKLPEGFRFRRTIGGGGQGDVILCDRIAANGGDHPVAMKLFSPERYSSVERYSHDMSRIENVASMVAKIGHENVLGVQEFLSLNNIRIMAMDWIEGFDFRNLMTTRMYGIVKERVSEKRWDVINRDCVTAGEMQPRLREPVLLDVVRDCLLALSALEQAGIVHGDLKPSNIMLDKHGSAKLIDIGSAIRSDSRVGSRACTPTYAAPEVLLGGMATHATDLKSLGYTAIELLTGRPLFDNANGLTELIQAKANLLQELPEILPEDIQGRDALISILRFLLNAECSSSNRHSDNEPSAAERALGYFWNDEGKEAGNRDLSVWIDELLDLEWQGPPPELDADVF